MGTANSHIFSLDEVAVAYALAAERMLGNNAAFLDTNLAVVPIFVSMLFQSLEVSIKHAGAESGLFTMQEALNRKSRRSGHGIKELCTLAAERLGGNSLDPIVMAMTFSNPNERSSQFIREMICGNKMEKTRDAYAYRRLGYGEVCEGDFALINPIAEWISSVKQTALNLPTIIDALSQWRSTASKSKHFAIWLQER